MTISLDRHGRGGGAVLTAPLARIGHEIRPIPGVPITTACRCSCGAEWDVLLSADPLCVWFMDHDDPWAEAPTYLQLVARDIKLEPRPVCAGSNAFVDADDTDGDGVLRSCPGCRRPWSTTPIDPDQPNGRRTVDAHGLPPLPRRRPTWALHGDRLEHADNEAARLAGLGDQEAAGL